MSAQVLGAVKWVVIGEGSTLALRFISNLIVSRLVDPAVFGLMALAQAISIGLQMFTEVGVRAAIVQHPRGDDADFQDTAWSLQVIRGCTILAICGALAVPMRAIYEEKEMLWLIPAIGLVPFIEGFLSTRFHLAYREMSYARVVKIQLTAAVFALIVRVGVALFHPTVLSLVLSAWTFSLTMVVLSFLRLDGHRNRFRMEPTCRRELMRFGIWVLASTILVFLAGQLDRLILAKLIPFGMLGAYSLAALISSVPMQGLTTILETIGFPSLSRANAESKEAFASVLGRLRLIILCPAGIAACALVISGEAIATVLFDDRYAAVGWILQVVSLSIWTAGMESINGTALMALGRPKLNAIANLIQVIAMAGLIPAGAYLGGEDYRLPGVLIGLLMAGGLKYAVSTIQARIHDIADWGMEGAGSLRVLICVSYALTAEYGVISGLHLVWKLALGAVLVGSLWWKKAWRAWAVVDRLRQGHSLQ